MQVQLGALVGVRGASMQPPTVAWQGDPVTARCASAAALEVAAAELDVHQCLGSRHMQTRLSCCNKVQMNSVTRHEHVHAASVG
eukprot:352312-Chlamydomonas_euryale.AAC.16